jgi:hypothetical protein
MEVGSKGCCNPVTVDMLNRANLGTSQASTQGVVNAPQILRYLGGHVLCRKHFRWN